MCGLIGSYCWQGEASSLSLEPLRHRGPDSSGSWFSADHCCWLGHTRLAVQDLTAAGHQPITSQCGTVTLVFNGEIYNHLELRSKLRIGTWRGHSDSETLVEGIAQFGSPFLRELRGMFAIAAFHSDSGTLLLARDRLGIKPLYYKWHNEQIQFASERHALPGSSDVPPQMITQALAFGHDLTPTEFLVSPTSEIQSLPPGSLVHINSRNLITSSNLWPSAATWSQPCIKSFSEACLALRRCLHDVITKHLLADTEIACFLSSGLDSGIVVAFASRLQPGSIETFTVALPGATDDESTLARQMSIHCSTRHHELILTDHEAMALVERGLALLDIPTADALNTFVISQAASASGFRVALSGLGADELFGGYPSHQLVSLLSKIRWIPSALRIALLQVLSPRLARKLDRLPSWDVWHLSLAIRRWVGDSDLAAASAVPLQWPLPPACLPTNAWSMISLAELYGYTEPMLLRDSDFMSMACGLELRVPFLDHQLVEFSLSLPPHFHRSGKGLLRRACQDLFPPGYLNHRKQGFLLPMRRWMMGPLRQLCLERLDCLIESHWLDARWIRLQWQLFESEQLNWPRAWTLVVLGEFARRQLSASIR